jgi:hypothetical protein
MQDTPCRGFQFKYSVLASYDAELLGIGLKQRDTTLRVQILTPDGVTVLFDSTIKLKYTLVTLNLGGMVLFTWWTDMANAKITTTIPSSFTTQGGEQPYTIPGGDSSYTDRECLISYDLYSPRYMIPLPAGAIFKVKFHDAGMAGLTFVPVQTSVLPGGGVTGARMAQDGMTRLVNAGSSGLEFVASCDIRALNVNGSDESLWPHSAAPRPIGPQVARPIPGTAGAGFAQIFYLRQIKPVIMFQVGGNIRCAMSDDDGVTWRPIMQIASGADLVAGVMGPDGGTFYLLATRGAAPVAIIASLEPDPAGGGTIIRAIDEYPATGLPSLSPGALLQYVNGQFLLVVQSGSGISGYLSRDMMRSWS